MTKGHSGEDWGSKSAISDREKKKHYCQDQAKLGLTNTQLGGEWWGQGGWSGSWHNPTRRQDSSMAGKKFSWHILPEIHSRGL